MGEGKQDRDPVGRRLLRFLASLYSWVVLTLVTVVVVSSYWVVGLFGGGTRAWQSALHYWARALLALGPFRLRVEGLEDLPDRAVLTSNHQGILDIAIIAAVVSRPVYFVARRGVLSVPFIGTALAGGGHLIVDRDSSRRDGTVLERAAARLQEPGRVLFFPEGTRSADGSVGPFRSGAFRVAVASGRPLVPVAIAGSRFATPKSSKGIFPARVAVAFLDPLTAEQASAPEAREEVRQRIVNALARLDKITGPRI